MLHISEPLEIPISQEAGERTVGILGNKAPELAVPRLDEIVECLRVGIMPSLLRGEGVFVKTQEIIIVGLSVLTGLTGGYIIAWPVMTILCGIQPKTQNTKLNVALNIILSCF